MTMTYTEYAALPGLRFSDLSRLAISPACYQARAHVEREAGDTVAMALGRAAHAAILEPDVFARTFTRRPEEWADWRSKASQEWRKEAERAGSTVLDSTDYTRVAAMARAVHNDALACRHLRDGAAEQVIQWQRPDGRRCKARLDWLGRVDGHAVIVDLKTTRLATRQAFGRAAAAYHYYAQLAWYLDGLIAAGEPMAEARIITVGTLAPHDVVVYRLTGDQLDGGWMLCARWLAILEECEQTDSWPGIGEGKEQILDLPPWAYPGDGDDLADLNLDLGGEGTP